tara:strand:- start:5946 stop:6605 length:660 start_codon:yes stop_codon:yes gene_type:complete
MFMNPLRPFLFFLFLSSTAFGVEYERDIMPIFIEKCADCHSTKAEKLKAGLVFDDPERFHKRFAKNDVVIPGDWDASYLFVTLFRPPEAKEAMPPKGKGDRLTAEEVVLVMQWIADGAPINGTKGDKGTMPEDMATVFADLPPGTFATAPELRSMNKKAAELPVEESWTNREGQMIQATFLRVEGEIVLLKLTNGTVIRYPIAKLSTSSQARITELSNL